MDCDIEQVLFSEKDIDSAVRRMGEQIACDYTEKDLLVVGVLKGAFVFTADLVRAISIPLDVDFVGLASYKGAASSGHIVMTKGIDRSIKGKHVLITEGVVDTGRTLSYLLTVLSQRGPASLAVCTLLDKPARRYAPVAIAYRGYEIEDHFIVGYGMDFRQNYRHLPYIGVLKKEIYG
ncbi:MAG: hypoxanthine phosphoribosyltransferase [Armatimonadetes bacterium]|nr:hypoxanthine phosphoribosyltransferase [Armatimonadota bacterium]